MRDLLDEIESYKSQYGSAIPAEKFLAAISVINKVKDENVVYNKFASEMGRIEQVNQMYVGLIRKAVKDSETFCQIFEEEIPANIEQIVKEVPVIMCEREAGQELLDNNIKRGRGKPTGSTKENARRVAIKIRWKDAEIEEVRAAAEAASEDVSAFIRAAALSRAYGLIPEPE